MYYLRMVLLLPTNEKVKFYTLYVGRLTSLIEKF